MPLIKYERAGKIKLMMKGFIFTSLVLCSIIFCHNTYKEMHVPSFHPLSYHEIDSNFGFLCSYLVIPLLAIAEDRVDYSKSDSDAPRNSAQSFKLFVNASFYIRFIFGFIICLTMA